MEHAYPQQLALYRLDEAIFEWAHLVAGLTSVDGAVQVVKWKDGLVTCWNQVGASIMDA